LEVLLKDIQENLVDQAESIFEDPELDIVSIASYDSFHAEQIIQCLNSGKHVFVENPSACIIKNST